MKCTEPVQAWYGDELDSGKREIIFNSKKSIFDDDALLLPCGKCPSCQGGYAGSWATRLWCESLMHDQSCCITLTYNDDNLPEFGNINLDHASKFIRALRDYYRDDGIKIKYFAGAEYGSDKGRPHYHVIVYGYCPSDGYKWRKKKMVQYYRSATLEKFWKKGNVEFAEVSPAACSYVANYCLKKLKGKEGKEYYHESGTPDMETGEWIDKVPESARVSKGLGKSYFLKYLDQLYPADFIVVSGRQRPLPRAFDKWLQEINPVLFEAVKEKRRLKYMDRPRLSRGDLDAINDNVVARRNMFSKRTMELL